MKERLVKFAKAVDEKKIKEEDAFLTVKMVYVWSWPPKDICDKQKTNPKA